MKSILMGVACVLGTAACVIPYLAMREQYDMFAGGKSVRATVVKTTVRQKKGWVKVRVQDRGKPEVLTVGHMTAQHASALRPGQTVEILRHRRSPIRVRLRSAIEGEKPSIFFLVGAAAALSLAVYFFLLPWLRRRRRAARTDPIEMVLDALKRTRLLFSGMAVGLLGFGGFLVFLLFFTKEGPESTGGLIGAAVVIAAILAIAVWSSIRAFRLANPRESELFQVITNQPERIGWIYHTVATSSGVSAMTVNVWLTDGSHHPISVSDADADDLLEEIARRAPGALVGFTPENKSRYHEGMAGAVVA